MSKRYSDLRCLFLIISIVFTYAFFNLAWAAPPEIYSIIPNTGSNKTSTYVTINGANFQPTPKVALYGGGHIELAIAIRQTMPMTSMLQALTPMWLMETQDFR